MCVWLSSRVKPRLKNRGARVFALVQISFFVLQSEHVRIPMPSISICDICGWLLVSNTRSIGAIVCKNFKACSIIFYLPSASNPTTIAKDFDFCWHHLRGRNCSTARSRKWRDLSSVQRSGRLWQLWNFGGGTVFEVTRTFCQCTRVTRVLCLSAQLPTVCSECICWRPSFLPTELHRLPGAKTLARTPQPT